MCTKGSIDTGAVASLRNGISTDLQFATIEFLSVCQHCKRALVDRHAVHFATCVIFRWLETASRLRRGGLRWYGCKSWIWCSSECGRDWCLRKDRYRRVRIRWFQCIGLHLVLTPSKQNCQQCQGNKPTREYE